MKCNNHKLIYLFLIRNQLQWTPVDSSSIQNQTFVLTSWVLTGKTRMFLGFSVVWKTVKEIRKVFGKQLKKISKFGEKRRKQTNKQPPLFCHIWRMNICIQFSLIFLLKTWMRKYSLMFLHILPKRARCEYLGKIGSVSIYAW